jgi:hypothetical protein
VYSISYALVYKFRISLDAPGESPTLPAFADGVHFVSQLPGAMNSNADWAALPPVRQGNKPG